MERHKRMKTAKSSFTKMVITYIVVITIVVSSTSLVWATDVSIGLNQPDFIGLIQPNFIEFK